MPGSRISSSSRCSVASQIRIAQQDVTINGMAGEIAAMKKILADAGLKLPDITPYAETSMNVDPTTSKKRLPSGSPSGKDCESDTESEFFVFFFALAYSRGLGPLR